MDGALPATPITWTAQSDEQVAGAPSFQVAWSDQVGNQNDIMALFMQVDLLGVHDEPLEIGTTTKENNYLSTKTSWTR